MKWLIGSMAIIAVGQAGARAQGPGLRSGEVPLHIVARGETTSRADRIVVPVTVTGRGSTVAEARASAEATAAQVQAALVAAGVDRAAITVQPSGGGRVSMFDPMRLAATMAGNTAGHVPSHTDTVSMQVTATDRVGLDRVTRALANQEQAQAGTPVASLRDEATARRAAVAAAVARARQDADDYAAALGMRVVRVTSASNAAGLTDGIEAVAQSFRDLENRDRAPDTVVTRATSVVDYALAPHS